MKSTNKDFEFEVLVNGYPAKEYRHAGKVWIEGREGSNFSLRIRNNTLRRVKCVLSVDGLSVMTGKSATKKDVAYVLEPRENLVVPGWRLNNESVAKFFFTRPSDSYAVSQDKPENLGVIGLAVFYEKFHIPQFIHHYNGGVRRGGYSDDDLGRIRLGSSPVMGSAMRTMRSKPSNTESFDSHYVATPEGAEKEVNVDSADLGTGFGDRTGHRVHNVSFDSEENAAAVMEIRYASEEALVARGIVLTPQHHKTQDVVLSANPFPGEAVGIGSTPPQGWRG